MPESKVPTDSPTLSFPYLTNEKATAWLRARRGPVLGYSQAGLPYFLGLRDNTTVRLVEAAGWGGTHDVGQVFTADRFHFLDSAQQGRGMTFSARRGHTDVSAAGTYTLVDVTFADTLLQVQLTDPQHRAANFSLDGFREAFGAEAVHADVRFYSPDADVDPHIVTVDDWLPTGSPEAASGAQGPLGVPLILKALATFLDEHLSAPPGPGGAGYAALEAMRSGAAFDAILGRTLTEFTPVDRAPEVSLRWLRGNATAGNLITLTTLPSNLPGAAMDLLPGLLESRAYAVLGMATDTAGQSSAARAIAARPRYATDPACLVGTYSRPPGTLQT